jgi:hypothetical protein
MENCIQAVVAFCLGVERLPEPFHRRSRSLAFAGGGGALE